MTNTTETINEKKHKAHNQPKIVVLGVGGAGCNAVNNMINAGLIDQDVIFVSCNTDQQALDKCSTQSIHVQLGPKLTKGLGAGADPKRGEEAAKESIEDIVATFADAHMLFIAAGAGGGTGGGGAPEIAKAARKLGILTVGFITRPFQFEGIVRLKTADESIQKLEENIDSLIVIQNQNLLNHADITVLNGFAKADEVLRLAISGIVNIIRRTGIINVDFQDVTKVLKNRRNRLVFGVGRATGEDAGYKAAEDALSNPLTDSVPKGKIDTVLISITGGKGLALHTVQRAADTVCELLGIHSGNVIVGMTIVAEMPEDEVEVCVFASCSPQEEISTTPISPSNTNTTTTSALENLLNQAKAYTASDITDLNDQFIGKSHNLQETTTYSYQSKDTDLMNNNHQPNQNFFSKWFKKNTPHNKNKFKF